MEACRSFIIPKLCAKDLENIRYMGSMKVFVVSSVSGGPSTNSEFTTSVDYKGETNPKWNKARISLTLHETSLQNNLLSLTITFYCERSFRDNKYVGGTRSPSSHSLTRFLETRLLLRPSSTRWYVPSVESRVLSSSLSNLGDIPMSSYQANVGYNQVQYQYKYQNQGKNNNVNYCDEGEEENEEDGEKKKKNEKEEAENG